VIGITPR